MWNVCPHSRVHDLTNCCSRQVRITSPKAIIIPWKVQEKVAHGSGISLSSSCRDQDSLLPQRLADQAPSQSLVLQDMDVVLQLCLDLGIVVSWEKSQLVPYQCVVYLRVILDSLSFRASPSQPRVEKLLSIGNEFLSSAALPVSSWLMLLGILSSLTQLIPGGRLRMCSLRLLLHRSCEHGDSLALVRWDIFCRRDLEWWLVRSRLESGISLAQVSPDLDIWSDASDVGLGAHLVDEVASGLWSPEEA